MDVHWQASRHPYPRAELPGEAELVIVGGGIVGCSLALALAEAGRRPVLIERGRVAGGASGRNGGLLLPGTAELFGPLTERWGAARAAWLWGLATRGAEQLVGRIEALEAAGLDCGWRPEGGLHVATSADEARDLERDAAALAAAGFEARWLDRAALAGWSDLPLPPSIEGALLVPSGGSLHSGRLVTALAAAAVAAGARIVEQVAVTGIGGDEASASGSPTDDTPADGSVAIGSSRDQAPAGGGVTLETTAGRLHAGAVIVAANAWAGRLLPELAAAITPVRGQVLSTAPLPPRRIRGGWSLNRGYEYLQQRPDGRLVLGGMRWTAPDREVGRDTALAEPGIQARLDAWLAASWPGLWAEATRDGVDGPPVERRWAGIMAWTPDRLPLIGSLPGRPGLWLACGFSGHGVPFAPMAAEILVAALAGKALPAGSEAFDPARYTEGAPPARP